MFNGIIRHLGEGVMPDVQDVFWLQPKHEGNIISPDHIFSQVRRECIRLSPFNYRGQVISMISCLPLLAKRAFSNQSLQMLINRLASNSKMVGSDLADISRMFSDFF